MIGVEAKLPQISEKHKKGQAYLFNAEELKRVPTLYILVKGSF